MPESVHLFYCGSGFKGAGLFALSNDPSGANLPKADCPAGWAFDKSVNAVEGEIGGIPLMRRRRSLTWRIPAII